MAKIRKLTIRNFLETAMDSETRVSIYNTTNGIVDFAGTVKKAIVSTPELVLDSEVTNWLIAGNKLEIGYTWGI